MSAADKERLGHILDAIALIETLDTARDIKTRMAIERALEIIGEAANHVSKDIQKAHPVVPWAQIIGYRNKLIHGYFGTDENTVWNIVDHHLDALHEQISTILHEMEANQ